MSAIVAEGVRYVILLIPNRIREIKEEGRKEGYAEGRAEGLAEARAEGYAKGLAEARAEGRAKRREESQVVLTDEFSEALEASIRQGFKIGRDEERERQRNLLAQYDRGEIAFDEFLALLADPRDR